LGEYEGFGQVIVGPGLEVLQLVFGLTAGREYENGHFLVLAPNATQDLRATEVRQHQIQNDEVVSIGVGHLPARLAVQRRIDRIALCLERIGYQLAQLLLIFDNQYPHDRSSRLGANAPFTNERFVKDSMWERTIVGLKIKVYRINGNSETA